MGRKKNLICIIAIVLMIFSMLTLIVCSSATAEENTNKTLENNITLQFHENIDKYNMTEAEKKMGTDLLSLVENKTGTESSLKAITNSNDIRSSNFIPADPAKGIDENLVYVYVYLNEGISTKVIEPFVQEITDRDEENSLAVAWVSIDKLEELASLEEVRNIRTVVPPQVNIGSVTTEGDILHGTASVRADYGQNGTGIKIGVISDGVDNLTASQNTGDLPVDITILKNTIEEDSYEWEYYENEGTALLEIIHDMVPGAKLYFHEAGNNTIAFNNAVDALVAAGCNIIVDDIGWADEPYFEDGIVASHFTEIMNSNNVLFISAAGNDASSHYQGTYVNDGTNHHTTVIPVHLEYLDYLDVYLQWNDKFGSSSNDYDVRLYYENGTEVNDILYSPGATYQSITYIPYEETSFFNLGSEKDVYIAISNYNGAAEPKTLELFIYTSGTINSLGLTARDSICGHPAVPGVIAVGAISAMDENHDDIEYYSSQGPVTITYPVASQRQKPDICGVDDITISGAGGFGDLYHGNWYFSGTSPAAAHVAAVAAQIWGSNLSMTASEVRNVLLSNAADDISKYGLGFDYISGYGIANAAKYFTDNTPSTGNEINVEVINQFYVPNGFINDVAVADNYLYLTSTINTSSGIDIVDISNPVSVNFPGTCDTEGYALRPVVAGNYVYVVSKTKSNLDDGNYLLEIVDISNPASPYIAGICNFTGGNPFSIAVEGKYAYISNGDLVIIDISNSVSPQIASTYNTSGIANDVSFVGEYAYVADGDSGLLILNISNPASAQIAGGYDTNGSAEDIAVVGEYAYVADWENGLVILDLSNPTTPSLVGKYETLGEAYSVAVTDNYLYLADGTNGLVILDINNPSIPTLAAKYDTDGDATNVAVVGNYVYVSEDYINRGREILMLHVTAGPMATTPPLSVTDLQETNIGANWIRWTWTKPTSMDLSHVMVFLDGIFVTNTSEEYFNSTGLNEGTTHIISTKTVDLYGNINPRWVNDSATTKSDNLNVEFVAQYGEDVNNIAVEGNYVYLANNDSGVGILDTTNPSSPILIGSYDTQGNTWGAAIKDTYAYVADGGNGFLIVDISNPAAPTNISTCDTEGFAIDVAVQGNYAYVADESNGLVIVDVTNPVSPKITGTYNTGGAAWDVAVENNHVYVADGDAGLVIVDITNPVTPTLVSTYDTGSFASSVAVEGNHAYIADGEDGLVVVDITNPAAPTLVSTYDYNSNDYANYVVVQGNYAYVADGYDGLIIVDVTNPAAPTLAGTYDTIGSAWAVAVEDEYAYVADTGSGLVILHITAQPVNTTGPMVYSVAGKDITTDSITLAWKTSNTTTKVQILRDNVLIGDVSVSTSYKDSNLAIDTTYTYTLIPYNSDGVAGKAVDIILKTKSSHDASHGTKGNVVVSGTSGGSGGGGSSGASTTSKSNSGGSGGGAGSAEDFANVAMKDVDTQYLKMNANITYEFSRDGNPIQSVDLYSLKNSGDITSTIEVLNNISKLVNSTPEGSIYKYVNIWVGKNGFATETNIKDAHVKFKVNSSWIKDMGLSPADIMLQRYNGESWEVLPTTMESNTTEYMIFVAKTPGFSPFAITAEKTLASPADTMYTRAEDVGTNGTQPEKTPGFGLIMTIFMIGVLAIGHGYLKKRQN